MFTGLVENKGVLAARTASGKGARLRIQCALDLLTLGESISVDGVCLTVDRVDEGSFEADASEETLNRTTLGTIARGREVNLERALLVGSRLGGHIVTGHVDGVVILRGREARSSSSELTFEAPSDVSLYIAEKGSVTVSGVSLTVNAVSQDRFCVMIIPHTLAKTTLATLGIGERANLEVDLLARYIARLLEARAADQGASSAGNEAWLERLKHAGYL